MLVLGMGNCVYDGIREGISYTCPDLPGMHSCIMTTNGQNVLTCMNFIVAQGCPLVHLVLTICLSTMGRIHT